jgi:hypothetical protein
MAVDYYHQLLVEGSPADVRSFRRSMWREFPRTVGRKTWTEVVPFSFGSLYMLAPDARRIFREPPGDPFELSVWPIRRLAPGVAEVRYRFHTRGLKMKELLQALSRALPAMVFTLSRLCLDTDEVDAYRLRAGKSRHWSASRRLYRKYTKRERARLKGVSEDVDCDAEEAAVQVLLDMGLFRWRKGGSVRRLRWWDQEIFRELRVERDLFMVEVDDEPRLHRNPLLTQRATERARNAPYDMLTFRGKTYWPRLRPTIDKAGLPPERPVEKRATHGRKKRRR